MVVPVLITSCQVSEKWKSGPVAAQITTTASATMKAQVLPVQRMTRSEKRSKGFFFDFMARASRSGHARSGLTAVASEFHEHPVHLRVIELRRFTQLQRVPVLAGERFNLHRQCQRHRQRVAERHQAMMSEQA